MALTALSALMIIVGCGSESTGPSQGEGDWLEYTTGEFKFEWLVEDSLDALRIRLTAPTTGWLAVGFDPTSFMNESNLIIGYYDSGSSSVRDDYGTGQFTHDSDVNLGGTSDVELLSGSQSGGETEIEFRIPLDSGDQYDKVLAEGNTYTVIFAYGNDGADDFTSPHSWAESASLEI